MVITTHDRAHELDVAIGSVVRSPLIESPEQVIVVDDDSHDRTPDVARRWHARYVRVATHSAGRSRNAGWALADTEYVAFLDDDDAWLPGNMEHQLSALDAHGDAGFAYGIAQCATEDRLEPIPATFPPPPLASGRVPAALHTAYPQLGVVLFRRQALEEVDGFDPRVQYGEDADLMLRIASRREIVGVDFVGMLYRVRSASRARSDYFWAVRDVTRWRPRVDGVGWRTAARFQILTRGKFFVRFCEDAGACVADGRPMDALVCLARAAWISPAHALRHQRMLRAAFAVPRTVMSPVPNLLRIDDAERGHAYEDRRWRRARHEVGHDPL